MTDFSDDEGEFEYDGGTDDEKSSDDPMLTPPMSQHVLEAVPFLPGERERAVLDLTTNVARWLSPETTDFGTVAAETGTCAMCWDDDKTLQILRPCGHGGCAGCWDAHMNAQPKDARFIPCVEAGCTFAAPVLDVGTQAAGWAFVLARAVIPNVLTCANCNGVSRIVGGDPAMLPVRCPKCRVKQCGVCNVGYNHFPASCAHVRTWATLEQQFAAVVLADRVKPCPGCGMLIEHSGGCKHMTHTCGMHFCFVCLHPWADHRDANFYTCTLVQTVEGAGAADMLRNDAVRGMLARLGLSAAAMEADAARRLRAAMDDAQRAQRPLNLPFDVHAISELFDVCGVDERGVLVRAAAELAKSRKLLVNVVIRTFCDADTLLEARAVQLTAFTDQLHELVESAPAVNENAMNADTMIEFVGPFVHQCMETVKLVSGFRKRMQASGC